jgi:hypothetical protein
MAFQATVSVTWKEICEQEMMCGGMVLCGGLVAHNVCGVGSIFVVLNHNENPRPHMIISINNLKKVNSTHMSVLK